MIPGIVRSRVSSEVSTVRAQKAATISRVLLVGILGFGGICGTPAFADTVGYYRFEEGVDGAAFADSGSGVTLGTVPDSSLFVNNLNVYANFSAPTYSSTIPTTVVPLTGETDSLSAHFSGAQDIYSTENSGLSNVVFTSFTIETYVRFDAGSFGFQTLVGRDDAGNPGLGTGPTALFYLSKSGATGAFRVELINSDNTTLFYDSTLVPEADTWYHVAAVGDASAGTLSLYVDGVLLDSVAGFTGLYNPATETQWTLGRGQYSGNNADNLHGYLDEVRFSDAALDPSQFLNAAAVPEPGTYAMLLAGLGLVIGFGRIRAKI